jgi:hypothetical protein
MENHDFDVTIPMLPHSLSDSIFAIVYISSLCIIIIILSYNLIPAAQTRLQLQNTSNNR